MELGSKSDNNNMSRLFQWNEVVKHNKRDDKWIVVDGGVYDITKWADKHPGGRSLISHFAGQDATEAFKAFHRDQEYVRKYLKVIKIGELTSSSMDQRATIDADFDELRSQAKNMGVFESSKFFYFIQLVQFVTYEALAYYILKYFGIGWIPMIASMFIQATAQVTASWTQHDFGHRSVFGHRWDRALHQIVMNFAKGASANWWNHMHYQHHAKPNVIGKDPDVRLDNILVLGDVMPIRIAKKFKKSMPYNFQHQYFFFLLPPLLFPVYFQIMTFHFCIKKRLYLDLLTMAGYFIRAVYTLYPFFGLWWFLFYMFMARVIESHWFTWVSQSNHIPMKIDDDKNLPWLQAQTIATCNLEKSFFNDWFTGHLNFQIEHHLFPTMPRHNAYKIAPLVRKLCERHGIEYKVKPLLTAFCDIIKSLRHSGELWYAAYHAYHMD